MLEITGNDIAELSDTDLRTLIGLLCEAELSANGIPTAGVTWGGHQNAKDGGIDVRVEITSTLSEDSFIPRSKTGFQVKNTDMPRNKIFDEMQQPQGMIKPVIKELIDSGGAYVIVSSQGSVSDASLRDRKQAMFDVIKDYTNAFNIKLDFYDRNRVAVWVRSHPSLILWVREKIGKPIQGWKPYENWSKSPGGIEEGYLIDKHVRLYNNSNKCSEGLSVLDGIIELRQKLEAPKSSVRLVGLSGVGKTRLLQALFDPRIGEHPLNQKQVFYTDINDEPNPNPSNFAKNLIALRKPCILVVDNCMPDLHRRLVDVCSVSDSWIRLITVEYDVRDDLPEQTEVFRLEPASIELIEKVICTRFKHINKVNARVIAKFSGGNARIAIALCNAIRNGENLTEFRDEELFKRLFHQRNEPNQSLLRAAKACALVYSFDGQTLSGVSELNLIGSLVRMNAKEVYENVSELQRRDIVQKRGIWRAVLPPAIANKLAAGALQDIPMQEICNVFEHGNLKRLLQSFSKRLGFLHECDEAVEISRKWLSKDGLVNDISNLNRLGITILQNIAPLNPELILSLIESISKQDNSSEFFSRDNHYFREFTRLLISIAYDKELFERSIKLLCRFALSEKPGENNNSIRISLKSLFYLYQSGTHATPEQKLDIIIKLVQSKIDSEIELGMYLLDAPLDAWNFGSYNSFEFGAHSRDFGYSPKNKDEINKWFKIFIQYTTNIAISDFPVNSKAKKLLAEKFRGLFTNGHMYDELKEAAKKIHDKGSWLEGWVAVKDIKKYDVKNFTIEVVSILDDLDELLKAKTLIDEVKLYTFDSTAETAFEDLFKQSDMPTYNWPQQEENIRSLGYKIGTDTEIFKSLLPDILSNESSRLFIFGQGLAGGSVDYEKMWNDFCEHLSTLEESKRKYQVLSGFLNNLSEMNLCLSEKFLDEAVTNSVLAKAFPLLQISVKITPRALERLKKSLELGLAPIYQYINFGYKKLQDNDLCELLEVIYHKSEGISVAAEIFYVRLLCEKEHELSDDTISIGQELILKCLFMEEYIRNPSLNYKLINIIERCYKDKSSENSCRILCNKLVKDFLNNEIRLFNYNDILKVIAEKQPIVFMDAFLNINVKEHAYLRDELRNALVNIHDGIIIDWCEIDPITRYPIVASNIIPFQKNEEGCLVWTLLARKIIENFPDHIRILNKYQAALKPSSWSGSRAEIMQERLQLISELKNHENNNIAEWAYQEEEKFIVEIQDERKWEIEKEKKRNESFEESYFS